MQCQQYAIPPVAHTAARPRGGTFPRVAYRTLAHQQGESEDRDTVCSSVGSVFNEPPATFHRDSGCAARRENLTLVSHENWATQMPHSQTASGG